MHPKIISLQNPIIKHLVKLRLDPHYRKEQGLVLISGFKLVEELSSVALPKRIFTEKPYSHPHILVSPSVMKKITGLTTPEGIAAEFSLPKPHSLIGKTPLLALDRINDPGNMGTLLRTALALDWEGVFLLPNCVDPFHEKVIRASRGALFHLPWQEGTWEELDQFELTRYHADIEGCPLPEIAYQKDLVLLLSNEAQGVSEKGLQFGEPITIPLSEKMESLNVAVAGSIIMYALGRKL